MIIFERNFWKCLLRESLESVEKFLSSISFLLSISIPMTMPSITFDKGFDSFLITANLQNKNNPSGCLKKLNKWSHLYSKWFNRISKLQDLQCTWKRGNRSEVFCRKFVRKKIYLWQWSMKRVEHKKTALK